MSRNVAAGELSTTLTGVEPGSYVAKVVALGEDGDSVATVSDLVAVAGAAGTYGSLVHRDGAVAWWRLGELSSVERGANSIESGGIEVVRGPEPAALVGSALVDDADGGIGVNDVATPQGGLGVTGAFTLEGWLGSSGELDLGGAGAVTRLGGVLSSHRRASGSASYVSAPLPVPGADWVHVAVVVDSDLKVFVNGQLVIQRDHWSEDPSSLSVHGRADEVALYPVALTGPQLAERLAASGRSALIGSPTGLRTNRVGRGLEVSWNPVEGAVGYQAELRSGNGVLERRFVNGVSPNVTFGPAPGATSASVSAFGPGVLGTASTVLISDTGPESEGYAQSVRADWPVSWFRMNDGVEAAAAADSAPGSGWRFWERVSTPEASLDGDVSFAEGGALAGSVSGGFARLAGAASVLAGSADHTFSGDAWTLETWLRSSDSNAASSLVEVTSQSGPVVGVLPESVFVNGSNHELPTSVMDGEWHHVVVTHGDATASVFLDGQLVSTAPTTWPLPDRMLALALTAGDIATDPNEVTVDFDEVAVYGHALSPERVTAHFAASGRGAAPVTSIGPGQRVGVGESERLRVDVEPWHEEFVPQGEVVVRDVSGVESVEVGREGVDGTSVDVRIAPVEVGARLLVAEFVPSGNQLVGSSSPPTLVELTEARSVLSVDTSRRVPAGVERDATIVVASNVVAPTGTIALSVDDVPIGEPYELDAEDQGRITVRLPGFAAGPTDLKIVYSGGGVVAGSEQVVEIMALAQSRVTVIDAPDEYRVGETTYVRVQTGQVAEVFPQNPVGYVQARINGSWLFEAIAMTDINGEALVPVTPRFRWSDVDLTFYYNPANYFEPSESDPVVVDFLGARSEVTLSAASSVVGIGEPVELEAAVAPGSGSGTPAGDVKFTVKRGATTVLERTVAIAGGAAALAEELDPGTYTVTARYLGDATYEASSDEIEVEVAGEVDVTLGAGAASAAVGDEVEFTAGVSAGGLPLSVGKVEFRVGSTVAATADVVDGVAVGRVLMTQAPSVSVTARFIGDGFRAANSEPVVIDVTRRGSALTARVDGGPFRYGQPIRVAVDAPAPAGIASPSGPVTVKVGERSVGSWPLVNGSLDRPLEVGGLFLEPGVHTLVVSHGVDARWAAGSTSVVVTVIKSSSTVSVVSPPVAAADANVALGASVGAVAPGGGTPSGTFELVRSNGAPVIGPDLSPVTWPVGQGPGAVAASVFGPGDHVVKVRYSGDLRFDGAESSPVTVRVRDSAAVNVISVAPGSNVLGGSTGVSVTVTGAAATPTGRVRLFDGNRFVGDAFLSGGAATISTRLLHAGTRDLRVDYGGDSFHAPASSATQPYSVEPGTITGAVAEVENAVPLAGRRVTLVGSISGSGEPIRPTGTVEFRIGNNLVGTAPVRADGAARLVVNDLDAGDTVLRVDYVGGDSNFTGTATATVEFEVFEPIEISSSSVSDTVGVAPLAVTSAFELSRTADVVWYFGDGSNPVVPDGSGAAGHTYNTPGLYKATVVATDGVQQVYRSHTIRVLPPDPPVADPGGDQVGVAGRPLSFEGRNSRPHFGVQSYSWDFGDGTAAAVAAAPTHAYAEPGTYTVTLTVESYGRTATATSTATVVAPAPDPDVSVVVTTGGLAIEGADVVVNDQRVGRVAAVTNSDGVAALEGLADGVYTVHAVASGYRPEVAELTIVDGRGAASIGLSRGAIAAAEISHRQLSQAEIVAAGIDLDEPANNQITQFEIVLPYGGGSGGQPATVNFNSAGQFVGAPGCGNSCEFNFGGTRVKATVVDTGEGSRAVSWIVVPGIASFSKQFFEVSLIVSNLTTSVYDFDNGIAVLNLPDGLSLAPLPEPQTLDTAMDVPAGESRSVSWIVRGDRSGAYFPSATYLATLSPFGTLVDVTATAAEPIRVHGPEALELTVTADGERREFHPMRVAATLKNRSTVPLDNAQLQYFDTGQGALFQPRQQTLWTRSTLGPGETITAEMIVVPVSDGDGDVDGDFDVDRAFVRRVGGAELGSTAFAESDYQVPIELRVPDVQPYGQVVLEWDGAGFFDVFNNTGTGVFGAEPVARNVSGGSVVLDDVAEEPALYALSRPGGGGYRMAHNAVATAPGKYSSTQIASLDLSCEAEAKTVKATFVDKHRDVTHARLVDGDNGVLAMSTVDPPARQGEVEFWIDDYPDVVKVEFANAIDKTPDGKQVWSAPAEVEGCAAKYVNEELRGDVETVGFDGDPVNTLTGSFWLPEVDLAPTPGADGLEWTRRYDSGGTAGVPLWAFPYSETLTENPDGSISLRTATTQLVTFPADGEGGYQKAPLTPGSLETSSTGWRLNYPDGSALLFDEHGRTSARSFPNGQVVTITRDVAGLIQSARSSVAVDDSVGLWFTHDTAGRLASVTTGDGRTIGYSYDSGDRLVAATLPGSLTWRYGYDAAGNMTTITDPAGIVTARNVYDPLGRVRSQTNAFGGVKTYTYELAAHPNKVTEAQQSTSVHDSVTDSTEFYQYDGFNRLVAHTDPIGSSSRTTYTAAGYVESFTSRSGVTSTTDYYPPNHANAGLIQSVTSPTSTTSYVYDTLNRLTSQTIESHDNPVDTLTTSLVYDGANRVPSKVTAPGGIETTNTVTGGLVMATIDEDGVDVTLTYDDVNRLDSVTDTLDNTTQITYDDAGRVTRTETAEGRETLYHYNAAGQLITTEYPDDTTTTLHYDHFGRVARFTDQAGNDTRYTYRSGTGALEAITDPLGRVTRFGYDGNGNRTQVIHPDGSSATTVYGDMGRVLAVADETGNATQFGYDAEGRVATITDVAGLTTTTGYDDTGQIAEQVTPDGRFVRYTRDGLGRPRMVTTPEGSSTTTYNSSGSPLVVTDVRGVATTHHYSDAGRLLRQSQPGGRETVYGYDDAGRLESTTLPGGRETTVVLDGDGLVESVRSPEQLVTAYSYDGMGRVEQVTDPAGVVTDTAYDPRGMVAEVFLDEVRQAAYGYDDAGQLTSSTDALNNTTTHVPDLRGRTVATIDPKLNVWQQGFDTAGRPTSAKDPLGRETTYGYDEFGRPNRVSDPSGRIRTTSYDDMGRVDGWVATDGTDTLTAAVGYDPVTSAVTSETINGRSWGYEHNAVGDLTAATNPDGRRLAWGYDPLGRVTSVTSPEGFRRDISYDARDNPTAVTSNQVLVDTFTAADGTAVDPSKWTTTAGAGASTGISDNAAALAVTATANSNTQLRVASATRDMWDMTFTVDTGDAGNSILQVFGRYLDDNNYDRLEIRADSSNLALVRRGLFFTRAVGSVPKPAAEQFRVRYRVGQNWVQLKVWAVDAVEPESWSLTVQDSTPYTWGVPRFVALGGPGRAGTVGIDDLAIRTDSPRLVAEWAWDDDGRLVGEQLPSGVVRSWSYSQGRLGSFSQTGAGTDRSTSFAYDGAGRVRTETTGSAVSTFGYDDAGQLTSVSGNAATAMSVQYNELGQRTTSATTGASSTYSYDPAGQLASLVQVGGAGAGTTTYSYDPAGRRTAEIGPAGARLFGYDPAGRQSVTVDPVVGTSVRALNPAGLPETVTTTGGPSGSNGTVRLDWDPAGELVGYTTNQNRSSTLTRATAETGWSTATTGATLTPFAVDAYGSVRNAGPAATAALAVAGNYRADGTPASTANAAAAAVGVGYRGEVAISGDVFLRARDYDPASGVFTTVDPVAGQAGSASANYPYQYANNNPVAYTDPSGMFAPLGWARDVLDGHNGVGKWLRNPVRKTATVFTNAVQWVDENRFEIAVMAIGAVVGALCTASTLGVGAVGCLALAGAATGAVMGAVNSCGNGNTAGQCLQGIATGAAVEMVLGVATAGIGKALAPLLRGAIAPAKRVVARAVGAVANPAKVAITTAATAARRNISTGVTQLRNSLDHISQATKHTWSTGRNQTAAVDFSGSIGPRGTPSKPAGVELNLRYKESWTPEQRAAADLKVDALDEAARAGQLQVTPVERSGRSAASRYRSAGNDIAADSDVDHVVDLQLGGADTLVNMSPLDSSVNRSLGAQVACQIRALPAGTPVSRVSIC